MSNGFCFVDEVFCEMLERSYSATPYVYHASMVRRCFFSFEGGLKIRRIAIDHQPSF